MTTPRANWKTPDAFTVDVDENTDRLAWLRERRNGLGGTDAAAILGVHVSRKLKTADDVTAADVYAEKLREDEPVDQDIAIFALGHAAEPELMQRVANRHGIRTRPGAFYRRKDDPWAYANPDALASDGGIVECKTASNRSVVAEQWLDGEISEHAYAQAQHYLWVTGRSHVYFSVGIRNDFTDWESVPREHWTSQWFLKMTFKSWVQTDAVERDEDYITRMVQAERAMWASILSKTPPPNLEDALRPEQRWPKPTRKAAEAFLPEQVLDDVEAYQSVLAQQKHLKKRRDEIETRLKRQIGSAAVLTVDGTPLVKWGETSRTSFDQEAFKLDHPDLFDQYQRTTHSRRFGLVPPKKDATNA